MDTVTELRENHRKRRYWMKVQQKLDRALESYIRINHTDWALDIEADEKKRASYNMQVKALITQARNGEGPADLVELVLTTDQGREPADTARAKHENHMRKLARQLPVYAWIEQVPGAAELGLATIVAECGDLANYANVGKVWKRLGFAPYDGLAGSTWKRDKWRTRKLTSEEWVENPFSGERYALMRMIAESLFKAQWIGKKHSEDGVGKPKGYYGEVYAKRRAHTKITHPDWSDGHSNSDALRVMMKAFLADLWGAWNGKHCDDAVRTQAMRSLKSSTAMPESANSKQPRKKAGSRTKLTPKSSTSVSDSIN